MTAGAPGTGTEASATLPPLPPSQQVVEVYRRILADRGCRLDSDTAILDFGCGTGRHTYEFLDKGYANVVGFDQRDYLRLRRDADRDRFRFAPAGSPLPFDDASLDVVVSTSVFEHVVQPRHVIAEIARVLRPDGCTVHVFPSKWRPIEPHIFVPFGGALQSALWLGLWARLGIRNEFQRGDTAADVIRANRRYCREGLAYWTRHELEAQWRACFDDVRFCERSFIASTRDVSRVSQLMERVLRALPPVLALYRHFHTRVVVATRPRPGGAKGRS